MLIASTQDHACGLCATANCREIQAHGRRYLLCDGCGLIALAPELRLPPEIERARYELHCNDASDEGYRAHLARAVDPLLKLLKPGAKGLDFGCGPGPAVALMCAEAGFEVSNYDPFFVPEREALQRRYEFIVCTETAEHFFIPRKEFDLLNSLLEAGGYVSLMTRVLDPSQSFSEWFYPRDPTHVSFYSRETFDWIARHWGWDIIQSDEKLCIFRK